MLNKEGLENTDNMATSISLSVMVPALNEGRNLRRTIDNLAQVLEEKVGDWEIILVNDGSIDHTGSLADELARDEPRIKVMHHQYQRGLGSCWKDGVNAATKNAVAWFPGDGENDPYELVKYLFLLEHVDLVIPYITNRDVRPWYRRFLSRAYLWVINLSFGTMLSYITGNVLYRRYIFEVVKPEADGFFTLTECPIKALSSGFTYVQVPERLGIRQCGHSTILTTRSIITIIREYLRLLSSIYLRQKPRRVSRKVVRHREVLSIDGVRVTYLSRGLK